MAACPSDGGGLSLRCVLPHAHMTAAAGPTYGTALVLKKLGLTLKDMDVLEVSTRHHPLPAPATSHVLPVAVPSTSSPQSAD